MQRKLLYVVAAIVAALAVFTGEASASGPAPPGKEIVPVTCEGIGTLTVSVQRGENSKGVGQIVGAKGHGIGVAFTFIVTDLTTEKVLNTESSAGGGGHAHPNQSSTTCSGVAFSAPAEEFFGKELPPGVSATDTIQASFVAQIIVKL